MDKGQEAGGTFLVGYRGRLFRVDSDYQVGESVNNYCAVGCGADLVRASAVLIRVSASKLCVEYNDPVILKL